MTTSTAQVPERIQFYQNALMPVTGNGKARLLRHWDYVKLSDYNQLVHGGSAIISVGVSALAGAFTGAKIGGRIGAAIAREPGAKVGTGIGFTVGFTGGAAGGTYVYLKVTENSTTFKTWIDERSDDIVDNAISTKYAEDDILKNHICPITAGIMLTPVRTPQGHLFDREALRGLVPDAKGRVICPYSRELFMAQGAKMDVERALLINKRIYQLTCLDIQGTTNNPGLMKILKLHNSEIKELISLCYNGIFASIEKRREDKVTTFAESQQERADFVAIFGETVDSELDWSADWQGILKTRWIHFYPDVPVF